VQPIRGDLRTAADFGKELCRIRGRLTQATVAKRSVVDRAALTRQRVSAIENGSLPTAEQLRCFLHGCGHPELFDDLDAIRSRVGDSEPEPHRPRRRLLVAGALGVAVLSAAVAVLVDRALLADRTAALPQCAPDFVCYWAEPAFGGEKVQLPPALELRRCIRLPFVAHSVQNSSSQRQWGYPTVDCSGAQRTILQHNGGLETSVTIAAVTHT
jgi:transcriptional regulator with XRE-family HTH domain